MEGPSMTNSPSSLGVTPLGLTIARKQLEGADDLLLEKKQSKKTRRQPKEKMITPTSWTKKKTVDDGKLSKNASLMALVEGVTLYATCMILPSLIGMILNLDRHQLWQEVQIGICERSAWICWHVFGAVLPSSSQSDEPPEPVTFVKNFVAPDTYLSDICVVVFLIFTMAFIRVLLVHILVPNNLAPQQMEALVRCKSIHLLSTDYKQTLTPRSETQRNVIALESLTKEFGPGSSKGEKLLPSLPLFPGENLIMRTPERPSSTEKHDNEGFGHETTLIPDNDHDDEQESSKSAIRRISSNDLGLSIDTPVQNTRSTITLESSPIGGFLQACSPRDDNSRENQHLLVDDSENDVAALARPPQSPLQEQQRAETISIPLAPTLSTPRRSPVPFLEPLQSPLLQPDTSAAGEEDTHEEEEGGGWKRRGSTASLAAAAAAAVQEEEEDHEDDDSHHHDDTVTAPNNQYSGNPGRPQQQQQTIARPKRLFAAPRYATAVFRLLYCTLSCAMAWYLFRDADFWPPYVGGHGSTARCWDLSGSLALAKNLDSDFDHRNTVLRRFFLVQASYHLHSGAFHVFSVVLLHFLKKDDEGDGSSSSNSKGTKQKRKKEGWVSLLGSLIHPRALLQHSLSLIFLSVSYVFSSLRRLGAIGMFALDISSWALHLLQTCLNAPSDSILSKPKVIKGVWALVVLPSFMYFRFFVWPMVGSSAMVESKQWLAQLESTLVPGSALWFRRTFLAWMMLWMGFHAIHFKRLVFHPHIQRIMGNEQASDKEKLRLLS